MSEEKKILTGVFGGSFDPPHSGHTGILKSFFEEFPECKEVFLIPNRQNPLKGEKISSSENVLEMLNLFIQEFQNPIQILDIELQKKGPSYTVDTLRELKRSFPDREFLLLIGEDNYSTFHHWNDWEEILQSVLKVYVFRRYSEQIPLNENLNKHFLSFQFLKNRLVPVSSTELRDSFAKSILPIRIPKAILDYISKNRLYSS
ncbi:nicotinate (nicotinamide) nucleotide adenylyltransferase [Leptospira sp. WS92.C1]